MTKRNAFLAGPFCAFLVFQAAAATGAEIKVAQWPQFRGPNGAGIANGDQPAPVEFGLDKNLLWKAELPAGHSSPCIWGDRIFLTGCDKEKQTFETLCLDRARGTVLWRRPVKVDQFEKVHKISNPATATPATDGKSVFVYFGSYGLIAFDLDGNELWKKPLPMPVTLRSYGTGTSPIIAGDLLILDVHLGADSYLLAVRCRDGATQWKASKPLLIEGWSTPVFWREGREELMGVLNAGRFTAHRLKDGSEQWWVTGLPNQICATPVVGDGLLFLTGTGVFGENVIPPPSFEEMIAQYDANKDGRLSPDEIPDTLLFADRQSAGGAGNMSLKRMLDFGPKDRPVPLDRAGWEKAVGGLNQFAAGGMMKNSVLAVRMGGQGDVTATNIVWTESKGIPEVPSPLLYKGRLYLVRNGGVVTCRDPATGKVLFDERSGAAGGYYSSPVAVAGRIYTASDRGTIVVFEAKETLKVLARNDLKEPIMATPSIVEGKLYVRTAAHLYAFSE